MKVSKNCLNRKENKYIKGFTPLEASRNQGKRQFYRGTKQKSLKLLTGFTLIEVLVVAAVIAAILAIVIPVAQTAFHKMRVHQAQSDISTLELALEGYKSKYGKYPDEDPVDALEDEAGDPPTPFMRFPAKRLVSNVFQDPWNMPYYYQSPGTHQTGFVDIASAGPDRQIDSSNWSDSDNDDNIDNWSQKR